MARQQRILLAVAVSAMAITFSIPALAMSNRTFVSASGSDSNTATNCGEPAPCRTFAAAASVLNPKGQIVVLDAGGYGAFTITNPLTVTAIGVAANITATSGNAITINTTGNVNLNGIELNGSGTAGDGILVQAVGTLSAQNMEIHDFTNGIDFGASGNLVLTGSNTYSNTNDGLKMAPSGTAIFTADNSKFRDNGNAGIEQNSGVAGVVDGSAFDGNLFGWLLNGFGTASRSSFRNNGTGASVGVSGGTGIFKTLWDVFASNSTGIAVGGGGLAELFSDGFAFNFPNAFTVAAGGLLKGSNPATTLVDPNEGSTLPTGTLTLQ